jgi:hypothetical protein
MDNAGTARVRASHRRDQRVGDEVTERLLAKEMQFLDVDLGQDVSQRLRRFNIKEFLGRDEHEAPVVLEQAHRLFEKQEVEIKASLRSTEVAPVLFSFSFAKGRDRHVWWIADDVVDPFFARCQKIGFPDVDPVIVGEANAQVMHVTGVEFDADDLRQVDLTLAAPTDHPIDKRAVSTAWINERCVRTRRLVTEQLLDHQVDDRFWSWDESFHVRAPILWVGGLQAIRVLPDSA